MTQCLSDGLQNPPKPAPNISKGEIHMRFCLLSLGLLLIFSSLVLAADVDGKWTGTISTPGGEFPVTFNFKAEGTTLTGTMLGQDNSQMPIKDGKIDGNNISFSVTIDMGGYQMNLDYKGVVAADQIKLSLEVMGQAMEFQVKKSN